MTTVYSVTVSGRLFSHTVTNYLHLSKRSFLKKREIKSLLKSPCIVAHHIGLQYTRDIQL